MSKKNKQRKKDKLQKSVEFTQQPQQQQPFKSEEGPSNIQHRKSH